MRKILLVVAVAAALLVGVFAATASAHCCSGWLSYEEATNAAIGADGSDNDLGNFCAAHGCVGYPWWQCCPQQIATNHWKLYFSFQRERIWTCRVDSYHPYPTSPVVYDSVEYCT
jgi:hypothetical protein